MGGMRLGGGWSPGSQLAPICCQKARGCLRLLPWDLWTSARYRPPFLSPVLSYLPRVDARSINSAGSLLQWMAIIHHACGFCSDVLVCPHTHSPLKVKGVPRWPWFVAQMGIPGIAPSVHPPLETRLARNKPQKGRQSNPRRVSCFSGPP